MHYAELFLYALILEISWIAAVRAVGSSSTGQLVAISMFMQTISYRSTLVLVQNDWTMIAGVLGCGVGALVGLRVSAGLSRKDGPTS